MNSSWPRSEIMKNRLPRLRAQARLIIEHTEGPVMEYSPELRGADILDPFAHYCPMDWALAA